MEVYKINMNTPVQDIIELDIKTIESGTNNSLVLTLNGNSYLGLNVGQVISYYRKIYIGNGEYLNISDNSEIISINGDKIEITSPHNKKYMVYMIDNALNGNIRVRFNENHTLFQQDVELLNQTLTLYGVNGIIASGLTFDVPLRFEDRKLNVNDCIVEVDDYQDCINECDKVRIYDYIFLPKEASRNSVIFQLPKNVKQDDIISVSFNNNPFLYENEGEIKYYEDPWEEDVYDIDCKKFISGITYSKTMIAAYDDFYKIDLGISSDSNEIGLGNEDYFSTSVVEDIKENLIPDFIDMERIKYVPAAYIETANGDDEYFIWKTPEGFEKCSDYDKIYTKIIPNEEKNRITDMGVWYYDKNGNFISGDTDISHYNFGYEYASYFHGGKMPTLYKIYNNGSDCKYYLQNEKYDKNSTDVTGITFCLHFLKRAEIKDEERITHNSVYTSGNVYYDSWHIDEKTRETTWWNDFDYSGITFNSKEFEKFDSNYGEKSDLIGYLNFTDNDIFYRKKKVGQSFLRLLFYTSPDPIEQKLLYYSTVFLDDGELYGKYIKQLQLVKQNGDWERNHTNAVSRINENAFVVLYSGGTRVDSEITITNEYNKNKSSEGFNIYLFGEDKYLNIENSGKTIYMRVEFNHAGNGKTTPLMKWPSKDGNYVPLTTDNFIESLYIPIKLGYINGKYVYTFKGCKCDNNNIKLVLYEPKLDMLEDTKNGNN